MQYTEEFLQTILNHLQDGVYLVDRHRKIQFWNQGAEKITGFQSDHVIGRFCQDNILSHVDGLGRQLCNSECPLLKTVQDGQVRETHLYLRHQSGHRVPVTIRTNPVYDAQGNITGAVETFSDNTQSLGALHAIEKLRQSALVDPLTEIGNHRYAQLILESHLRELSEYGFSFGLLSIDIDRFKTVNDRYGHTAGDQVICMVANTLKSNLNVNDFVARWDSQEFLVIISQASLGDLQAIAEKLRTLVEHSRAITVEYELSVTISIGGAIARPGDTVESITDRASRLMYASKIAGRNRAILDT